MTSPYIKTVLHTTVTVRPHQLNNNLYLSLKENLKKKVERKCYGNYGYVMEIYEILEKSGGVVVPENFNSSAILDVKFSCKLCMPLKKTKIICQVEAINKALTRLKNGPIFINIMAKRMNKEIFTHNIYNDIQYKEDGKYKNLKKNDFVKVEIIDIMFSDKDDKIIALGFLDNIATKNDIEFYYKDIYNKEMDVVEFDKYIEEDL